MKRNCNESIHRNGASVLCAGPTYMETAIDGSSIEASFDSRVYASGMATRVDAGNVR